MKKIKLISALTAVIILMTSLFSISANASQDIRYYGKVMLKAKLSISKADPSNFYDSADSESSSNTSTRSQVLLYDFDGNGVKELAVTYIGMDKDNMQHRYLSVYTLKNGKPKALIKKKALYANVSAPSEYIGVAKKGKTKYLFLMYRNNSDTDEHEYFKYYKIKGTKIRAKYTAKLDLLADRNNNGKISNIRHKTKLNGKKITPAKLFKWQKAFKVAKIKREKVTYQNKYPFFRYKCVLSSVSKVYSKYFAAAG